MDITTGITSNLEMFNSNDSFPTSGPTTFTYIDNGTTLDNIIVDTPIIEHGRIDRSNGVHLFYVIALTFTTAAGNIGNIFVICKLYFPFLVY